MDVFEKILSEIDKGIKTIEPLMKGDTRQIAASQIIGLEEAKKIVGKYRVTNADRIRNMSDEELAEMLGNMAEFMGSCENCPAVKEELFSEK